MTKNNYRDILMDYQNKSESKRILGLNPKIYRLSQKKTYTLVV